jgi:hypothetical protein
VSLNHFLTSGKNWPFFKQRTVRPELRFLSKGAPFFWVDAMRGVLFINDFRFLAC